MSMKLKQFDVKTAFLYRDIDKKIYMRQPEGYEDGTGRVCELKKCIYGLKQASRLWNRRITGVLNRFGLKATDADPCVFVNNDVKSPIILAIDDGLIVSKHLDMLMNELKLEFNVTACDAHHYLGLQIKRLQDGSIFIHQEAYARAVLERYNMENANPVAIPADRNQEMCITMHDEGEKVKAPYREAIGSRLYLSVATRPDITFAVHSASQYLENPKKVHWNAVKRILKYLKGTTSHGLYYPSSGSMHLSAYSDSGYAGDVETPRSTTGFILKFGEATVAWNSQKQKVVTLSTTEAEYLASCQTTKEIIWTKSLLHDLMKTENINTTLHMDNQSAIRLIKNPEFHRRSKHIDVKYHFIREKYDSGTFNLEYVSSEDQQADILTKPLARSNFERQRDMLHVINIRNINNTQYEKRR